MKYAALSMSGHRKTVRRFSVFLWDSTRLGKKGLLAEAHESFICVGPAVRHRERVAQACLQDQGVRVGGRGGQGAWTYFAWPASELSPAVDVRDHGSGVALPVKPSRPARPSKCLTEEGCQRVPPRDASDQPDQPIVTRLRSGAVEQADFEDAFANEPADRAA